jgi:hypothetical protein
MSILIKSDQYQVTCEKTWCIMPIGGLPSAASIVHNANWRVCLCSSPQHIASDNSVRSIKSPSSDNKKCRYQNRKKSSNESDGIPNNIPDHCVIFYKFMASAMQLHMRKYGNWMAADMRSAYMHPLHNQSGNLPKANCDYCISKMHKC